MVTASGCRGWVAGPFRAIIGAHSGAEPTSADAPSAAPSSPAFVANPGHGITVRRHLNRVLQHNWPIADIRMMSGRVCYCASKTASNPEETLHACTHGTSNAISNSPHSGL
jgi:hypothetical protein